MAERSRGRWRGEHVPQRPPAAAAALGRRRRQCDRKLGKRSKKDACEVGLDWVGVGWGGFSADHESVVRSN